MVIELDDLLGDFSNHPFQFFPQFPNTRSPLIVLQDINLGHGTKLAQFPNVELFSVKLDEFAADLLNPVHLTPSVTCLRWSKMAKVYRWKGEKALAVNNSFLEV